MCESKEILPSQRGLQLSSLNINKLTTHIYELRILLANNDVDIILSIIETKLNSNTSDDEVHIPGYEIIRHGRVKKMVGEGFASM